MFYNTVNLTGDELNDFRGKVESQSEKILAYFKRHPFNLFTPIEIYNAMGKRFLLTSVRRSMSDLTGEGRANQNQPASQGKIRGAKLQMAIKYKLQLTAYGPIEIILNLNVTLMKNKKENETSETLFEHFELFNKIAAMPNGADLLLAAGSGMRLKLQATDTVSKLMLVAQTIYAREYDNDITVMLPSKDALEFIINDGKQLLQSLNEKL